MKAIFSIIVGISLVGCSGMNPHQTRADLAAAPRGVAVAQLNKPPVVAYAVIEEMMRSCVDNRLLRTSGEKPGPDGRGGVISVASISTMLVSGRVWEMATLEPAPGGGTKATVYSANYSEQLALAAKFGRGVNEGAKDCD
jgi:hypothetical protein